MMTSSRTLHCGLALLLAAAPRALLAQVQEEEEQVASYGGLIYVESRFVDNALRSVNDNKITEFQVEYGADVWARVERELVDLSADYQFYQNEYLEDSQEDRFIHTGQSALVLGTENTFYQLDLGHSTQRFLADPGGPVILSNTDQRDITTVSPLLRLRPGRNNISIAGHYARIIYKETDFNNSERIGYSVNWLRDVTPIHSIGVDYMENEVEYEVNSNGDYLYRRGAFIVSAELRLLQYSLQLGVNEVEPVMGRAVDGLYYDLAVAYGSYRNTWSFTAQQTITDTSLGNANSPFFSEGITTDVSRFVQDQLERTSYGLAWRSDFLCVRCDLTIRAGYENESYFNVFTENRVETFGGLAFSYRLRPSTNLELTFGHTEREFAEGGRSQDYRQSTTIVALDFESVLRYFETRLWYGYENREPDVGLNYVVNSAGITLGYAF